MKSNPSIGSHVSHTSSRGISLLAGSLLLSIAPGAILNAAETAAPTTNAPSAALKEAEAARAKAEKPPPLPLHNIEGNGGIFATLSAYLVNPPRDGELFGRPAVGFSYVSIGHGQNLEAFTLTETPWKRLELGFGYDRYGLGDLPLEIRDTTGVSISPDSTALYNANARLQILKENEFDQKWLPALTFGTHFKYNNTYNTLNSELGGALYNSGITDNKGVDFTLYASKLLTFLPRPVLLNVGGRATKAVEIGAVGFQEDYDFQFEGNIAVFATDRLIFAAEFRQQPNGYKPIVVGGQTLVGHSGNWFTFDAAYILSKNATVAAGYGHFGQVLNHQANGVWGVTVKYEF